MSYFFYSISFFFFTHTATTEIYTLSLHDALPIYDALRRRDSRRSRSRWHGRAVAASRHRNPRCENRSGWRYRSFQIRRRHRRVGQVRRARVHRYPYAQRPRDPRRADRRVCGPPRGDDPRHRELRRLARADQRAVPRTREATVRVLRAGPGLDLVDVWRLP